MLKLIRMEMHGNDMLRANYFSDDCLPRRALGDERVKRNSLLPSMDVQNNASLSFFVDIIPGAKISGVMTGGFWPR